MENFKKKRKGSFLASFSDYPDFGLLAPSFGKNKNFLQKPLNISSQLAITCWKLTIETLEQGVKYVQN